MRRWLLLLVLTTPVLWAEPFLLRVAPPDATVWQSGRQLPLRAVGNGTYSFEPAESGRPVVLRADGYDPQTHIPVVGGRILEVTLNPSDSRFDLYAILGCGNAPKSVEVLPDGKHFVTALLDGSGIEVYRFEPEIQFVRAIDIPGEVDKGYVETLALPSRNELWVSQMSTAEVHILSLDTLEYQTTLRTGGVWSKVIAASEDQSRIYVSNWSSRDISVIDPELRLRRGIIQMPGIPRGMVEYQGTLYVSDFEHGDIHVVDPVAMSLIRTIEIGGTTGATRHLVLDEARETIYVSEMASGELIALDTKTLEVRVSRPFSYKPNTIVYDAQSDLILVSDRGPNNADSYFIPGPEFGRIFAVDPDTLEVVDEVWCGNQPTGLAMGGGWLVSSDFLDNTLRVFRLRNFLAEP